MISGLFDVWFCVEVVVLLLSFYFLSVAGFWFW